MQNKAKHILVLDIGMTNKKISLYDAKLERVAEVSRSFAPLKVPAPAGSGLPAGTALDAHDLQGIESWLFREIRRLSQSYEISAISVSCHGATFVCVDDSLELSAPCLLYTYEPGAKFHSEFYATVGDAVALQQSTGTPPLSAMINPAKGIFFLHKHFPEQLDATKYILNYPAYWGARLTGKISGEATYIGNHSYLWDYVRSDWSDVAAKLGVASKLPRDIGLPWDRLGNVRRELAEQTGIADNCLVTYGIHDSNASLLPYLISQGTRDFTLNSTGTWCVVMHPQERYGYQPEDLGKIVFFNQSALRKPVKTTIFLGGLEFETWKKLVDKVRPIALPQISAVSAAPIKNGLGHGVAASKGGAERDGFDIQSVIRLLREKRVFILPEIIPGSGQFPGSSARLVYDGQTFLLSDLEAAAGGKTKLAILPEHITSLIADRAEIQALLYLSLVIQSMVALRRSGTKTGTEVFVSGGFLKSPGYLSLLSSCLPENPVATSDIPEATSYGAALCAYMSLYEKEIADMKVYCELEPIPVPKVIIDGFDAYMSAWLNAIAAPAEHRPARQEVRAPAARNKT